MKLSTDDDHDYDTVLAMYIIILKFLCDSNEFEFWVGWEWVVQRVVVIFQANHPERYIHT